MQYHKVARLLRKVLIRMLFNVLSILTAFWIYALQGRSLEMECKYPCISPFLVKVAVPMNILRYRGLRATHS